MRSGEQDRDGRAGEGHQHARQISVGVAYAKIHKPEFPLALRQKITAVSLWPRPEEPTQVDSTDLGGRLEGQCSPPACMVRDALRRSQVYAGCACYGAALLIMRPGGFRVSHTVVLERVTVVSNQ